MVATPNKCSAHFSHPARDEDMTLFVEVAFHTVSVSHLKTCVHSEPALAPASKTQLNFTFDLTRR